LKNETKPIVSLWETIVQFNEVIETWMSKPLKEVNVADIEEFTQDWYRKLMFVQKNPAVMQHKGP